MARERDLVFRLKAEPDTVQVAASLKQISDQIQAANLTVVLRATLPDLTVLQNSLRQQLESMPIVVPVVLQAQGMVGMSGMMPTAAPGPSSVAPYSPPPIPVTSSASRPLDPSLSAYGLGSYSPFQPLQQTPLSPLGAGMGGGLGVGATGTSTTVPDASGGDSGPGGSIRSLDAANERIERINQMVNGTMRRGLYETFEAVTRLGRGFAYIGAVGQEDVGKVLDVLLKVEATINLIRGGVDAFRGLSDAVNAYSRGVSAVSEVHQQFGRSRGALEDIAETAVGGAVGSGVASSASGSSVAAGATGTAGLSGASRIGMLGAGAAWAAGIGMAGLAQYESYADAQYGGVRPGRFTHTAGSWIAQGGMWLEGMRQGRTPVGVNPSGFSGSKIDGGDRNVTGDVIEAASFGLVSVNDTEEDPYAHAAWRKRVADRQESRQFQRQAAQGRKFLTNEAGMLADNKFFDANQRSENDVEQLMLMRMTTDEQRQGWERQDRGLYEGALGIRGAGLQNMMARARSFSDIRTIRGAQEANAFAASSSRIDDAMMPVTISDSSARAAASNRLSIEDVEQRLSMLRGQESTPMTDRARTMLSGSVADAQNRLAELKKEELAIEQQINHERESGLLRSTQLLQQQVQTHQEIAASIRQQVSGNLERMGAMDESTWANTSAAANRMRKVQAAEAAGDTDEANRVRRLMSQEDLSLLRNTGDRESDDFVRSEYLRRAKARGADRMFGADDLRRAEQEEALAGRAEGGLNARQRELADQTRANREAAMGGRIEVDLKDNRTLSVNLAFDDDRLAQSAVRAIKPILEARDAAMQEKIRRELALQLAQLAQVGNQQAAAIAFNIGGK